MKRYPVGSILVNSSGRLATIIRADIKGIILKFSIRETAYSWESLADWLRYPNHKIILPFNEYINAITN